MSDSAWFSMAFSDPRHFRPFTNDVGEVDLNRMVLIQGKIQSGGVLDENEYPREIWGAKDRGATTFKSLPDLFMGYGYPVVSERCASILRDFDLGWGALRPVAVLQKDRKTPIGDHPWFCLCFGNTKQTFLPAESKGVELVREERWSKRGMDADGDIALGRDALGGPDIWMETRLLRAFFVSDRLGAALKKGKAASGFSLKKCRVMGAV